MVASPAVLFARLMSGARFRHLQAFAAVAEFNSASRAAQAIGMTQPAVTHLIADLEQLLECQLFYRHARGMRPTELAGELLPFVRRALTALEGGAEFVAYRRMNAHGVVRVGAIQGAISGLLVRASPAFSRAKPNILVDLQEVEGLAEQSALITQREVDLMLCRQPDVMPEGWAYTELMPDRLVVVAGPEHPLARRRGLTLSRLLPETWLRLPSSTHASRVLEELMVAHGCSPCYANLRTRSPGMTLTQLRSEHLLMLAPHSVVRQQVDLGLLAVLSVQDNMPLAPLGAIHVLEDPGPAAQAFLAFLCRFAKQHP